MTTTYRDLEAELALWTFMPEYRFELRILEPAAIDGIALFDSSAAMLVIHSRVSNTYAPAEPVAITATYPLPPIETFARRGDAWRDYFATWVRHCVHDRMCHEADEWLRRDGVMMFDPHATERTRR